VRGQIGGKISQAALQEFQQGADEIHFDFLNVPLLSGYFPIFDEDLFDPPPDIVPAEAEIIKNFFLRAFALSRVLEGMVNVVPAAGEEWTIPRGVIADHHDMIEPLVHELVDTFRAMGADVDADLGHDLDRGRPHRGGLGARRERLKAVAV
jgi:hypothetical protein